uniref:AB hydrolase-1 domain-containing protein n=1 Tax=Araucaria cunninghamii TaxID=56994 RepID=A0A0D6R4X3_ARACU
MGSGRGRMESVRRATRTVVFMVIMMGSLVTSSASMIVAMADMIVPCALLSMFTCCRSCYTFKFDWVTYSFRSSLVDVPLLSLIRSVVILCAYYVCDVHYLYYGPYLGITAICALVSVVILIVKVCLFTISDALWISPTAARSPRFKQSWGMPVMFLSSMLLALGHIVVAYRTRYQAARRMVLFQRIDPEAVLVGKAALHSYQKASRSLTPGKLTKVNSEGKMLSIYDDRDLPAKMLADNDSLFLLCEGLVIHYKIICEIPLLDSMIHNPFQDDDGRDWCITPGRPTLDNPSKVVSVCRSLSHSLTNASLHAPLMGNLTEEVTIASEFVDNEHFPFSHQGPCLKLESKNDGLDSKDEPSKPGKVVTKTGKPNTGLDGIVLIHGFGGGVFSWRHVMNPLARVTGCAVVAFDRPGWGLSSRPLRAEWEDKRLPNPYDLRSQVNSLFSFCRKLGLFSVVLVGHDDGGLLSLMAAEKVHTCVDTYQVEVRGVVLVGVSISREVVPKFARVLLHTSLGRHMLRPLLRTEIIQVANRRAWHDASKLTSDVLELYKAPLRVEGWDKALAEVSKLSIGRMLSSNHASDLLKAVQGLPVLIAAGAEDNLVSLQSSKFLASKFSNSRLVAISGCGHLPHEECPKELLAAIVPFVSKFCV